MIRWYKAVGISLIPVILAVIAGFFLSGRTPVVKQVSQPSETEQPNMRVQNLHLTEQAVAGNEWELLAREAEFYDAKQSIVVHQLQAQLLSKEAHPVHVIADSGQIDSSTGNMTIKGNIRLQYLEGYTVETDVLHWQATTRVLQTAAVVRMRSALVHIVGTGLLGNIEQQRFVLQDNVHATFQVR
jgi:LPS export ABC transporter protein LptC